MPQPCGVVKADRATLSNVAKLALNLLPNCFGRFGIPMPRDASNDGQAMRASAVVWLERVDRERPARRTPPTWNRVASSIWHTLPVVKWRTDLAGWNRASLSAAATAISISNNPAPYCAPNCKTSNSAYNRTLHRRQCHSCQEPFLDTVAVSSHENTAKRFLTRFLPPAGGRAGVSAERFVTLRSGPSSICRWLISTYQRRRDFLKNGFAK